MEFELGTNNLFYNIHNNFYYIGNGDIFIQGVYVNKAIEITCIKTCCKYNIDIIVSYIYKKVGKYIFDNQDDAINFNEMIKMWNKYNNSNLYGILFIYPTVFKMNKGNLLNRN